MIRRDELTRWAGKFGVAPVQIERDHLISHMLLAIGLELPEMRFFGGTALCRTALAGSRLSEDIDLLHAAPRDALDAIRRHVPKRLRREFPEVRWLGEVKEGDGYVDYLEADGITAIKVYVGEDGPNTRAWEFETVSVDLRYSDLAPGIEMTCPTIATFGAMKLAAWFDRHAPRDLFDLAGLARLGVLTDPDVEARLRAKMGTGVIRAELERVPRSTVDAWEAELAAQVGDLPGPEECLRQVRQALVGANS